jgi:leucyl-tRNA synthetase
MADFGFREIEERWRRSWETDGYHRTDLSRTGRKCYCLVMFLYPSGDKLHLGHWFNFVPADTWARFRRMQGDTVFEPIGYDSFGLPAENYAIKTGVHPRVHTEENIAFIREQLKAMGAMYDFEHEVATHRPEYYRWNQWLFLELFRAGLAYRAEMPVNWCDSCQTVLANEQVEDGACWRCGNPVERRKLTQWCFRITAYADRLLEGLERIQWPEETCKRQVNWIGRSEGAEIVFRIPAASVHGSLPEPFAAAAAGAGGDVPLRVFTTRPDTLGGVTYVVLAPEHPLVPALTAPERRDEVEEYARRAALLSEIDRSSTVREKTGVPAGAFAVNPFNGERVPVWVADYVVATYGTGAVMAVPAHDERDFAFARALGLPIRTVILAPGEAWASDEPAEAYTGAGTMTASGSYDGLPSEEGGRRVVADLERRGEGRPTVQYRLRDWLISRQRYWGAPIPIIHCPRCGLVPVPDEQLPVLLPEDVDFRPRGKSPLASSEHYMNVACPTCGGPARRDPDTMDTFVCSSWYYLRYLTPHLAERAFDPDLVNAWLPVDQYVGGPEHACGHLIYSRFITKFLHDRGYLEFDEPFQRLVHQGLITRGGEKMSKSHGNVVNPEDYLTRYGTDTLRVYLMFGFAFEEGGDWKDDGIEGVHRYLQRVWRLVEAALAGRSPAGDAPADAPALSPAEAERRGADLRRTLHASIKGCTVDLARFHFNTAVSRLMELTNALYAYAGRNAVGLDDPRYREGIAALVAMLAPFAPHLGEELWARLGHDQHVFDHGWPQWDESALARRTVTIVLQINGKIRDQMEAAVDADREEIATAAQRHGRMPELIAGRPVRKVVVVPNKLVNIVV